MGSGLDIGHLGLVWWGICFWRSILARPLRIEYEGAFYHVTARGNERKRIFFGRGIEAGISCRGDTRVFWLTVMLTFLNSVDIFILIP